MTEKEMIARIRVLECIVERLLSRSKKSADLVELAHPLQGMDAETGHIHEHWVNRFSRDGSYFEREYRWQEAYRHIFVTDATGEKTSEPAPPNHTHDEPTPVERRRPYLRVSRFPKDHPLRPVGSVDPMWPRRSSD